MGKGDTTPLKKLQGRLAGYRNKNNETNFCCKKQRKIQVFNTGYVPREGEWILSNSPKCIETINYLHFSIIQL